GEVPIMALHQASASLSLGQRWRNLARRWTNFALWTVEDCVMGYGKPEGKPRKRSTLLEVLPLEDRQMPSFGISLFANAAPDAPQGTYSSVGRTDVGLLDGDARLQIPISIYRSDTGGPTALVYDSNTVNVHPIVTVQVTSLGSDP